MKRTIPLLLIVCALPSWAQTDTSTIERVEIITIYEPDVAESVKVEEDPTLEDPTQPPLEYVYTFPQIAFQPKAVYTPIDPVYLKKEKDPNLNDNYIEAGMGNYLTTYLDASIFNTRDKYFTYGLQLNHHASSLSNNPYQARFSENRVRAFGQRERGGTFRSMLDYRRNVVHYYGYDTAMHDYELGDINQIYNDVNAEVGWTNNGSRANSDIALGFDLFDRLSGGESSATLDIRNRFSIGRNDLILDLGGMFNRISRSENLDRLFADISAHYQFRYKRFDFDAGILLNYIQNFENTNLFKYSPILNVKTYLVPNLLRFHAGVNGGLERNTMRSMTYANPFVGENAEFKNPFDQFRLHLGMNGKFKRFVEYGVRFQQTIAQDQLLFVTDTNAFRNMTANYNDMSIFSFSGELKLFISNELDLGFAGSVYSYQVQGASFASHMAPYEAKIFATVRVADKITLSTAFFAIGPRQALGLDGTVYDIGSINDLNLKAEYRYRKNISAFLNVQNILHQRYQLWNFHRAQGLNALAGIAVSL